MSELTGFLTALFGAPPGDEALYLSALTHPSHGSDNYQRLEFLGDRVLGLVMAEWLSDRFPQEREGQLSHRFTMLVSGDSCAIVARAFDIGPRVRLGKQARSDGAGDSDYVLGDAIEGLIGALYLDRGLDAARAFIHRAWEPLIEAQLQVPRHPKSLLHEWAEARRRKPPLYTVIDRSGPHHALRFTVKVSLGSAGEATGTGSSKQDAETAAAAALLEQLP